MVLGFIFLGLGILLLGIYFQKHRDGFQGYVSNGSGMMGSGMMGSGMMGSGMMGSGMMGSGMMGSVAMGAVAMGADYTAALNKGVGTITATLDNTSTPETYMDPSTGITRVWQPGRYVVPTEVSKVTPVKELDLISIDFEVRKRFSIIQAYKEPADTVLVKYISDADTFIKLDSLYNEVHSYVKYVTTSMANLDDYINKASPEVLVKLRQIIYTSNDYMNILYKIYVTFPSIVISSNALLPSAYVSITDDTVLANAVTMIRQELQQIPSVLTMIQQLKAAMITSADHLKNTPTSTSKNFYETYITYTRVNEIEYMGLKHYMKLVSKSKNESMMRIGQSNIIAYLTENIATMETVLTKVSNLPNLDKSSQSIIETRRDTYKDLLNTANSEYSKMENIEPFQSYSNPYVAPSVSTEQAREFTLRKREGFQSVKNPYRTVS